MWHEARKQEKKLRGMIVDYRKRAERRREFYEKFKADPTQFMQVHGRPTKIYLEPQIAASAENCMMPWQGDKENMIDRFDVRAHLDIIPEYNNAAAKNVAVEEEEENPGINYERYRILIQNELSGITEDKFLHQIHLEEQFGTSATTHSQIFGKNMLPKANKAAIGYTYEDSTPAFTTLPPPMKGQPAAGTEADEESEEEIDFDLLVNVDDLTHGQKAELNNFGTKYGLGVGEFMEYLNGDLEEKEKMRLAKLQEEEKQAMSGRKARRERRAYKDKLIMRKGYVSPPSYATYTSPTEEEPSSKRSSSRSESRSRSNSPEKITFITSFGGNESDDGGKGTNSSGKGRTHEDRHSYSTTGISRDGKKGIGLPFSPVDLKFIGKSNRRSSRSRTRSPVSRRRRRSRSRSHSPRRSRRRSSSSSRGKRRRRSSSSSSRSRSRSRRRRRHHKRSSSRSSSHSRSRSRSRGRGRKRRYLSRSSSRGRSRSRGGRRRGRRSRSRSGRRERRRSRSRSKGRYRRSRSSSRRRRGDRRSRSKSSATSHSSTGKPSKRRRSKTSSSSSPASRRSKSKELPITSSKDSDNGLEIVTCTAAIITKEPTPPPPPVRRYYGRHGGRSSGSESSRMSASGSESDDGGGGGERKNGSGSLSKRADAEVLLPKGKTLIGSTSKETSSSLRAISSAGTSGSSSASTAKLTPQERLRRKMQNALSKTFRADKEAEKQRQDKQTQERMEREESLRELTIKYRRREREKRHRDRDMSSSSSTRSSHSRSRSPSPQRRDRSRSKSPY